MSASFPPEFNAAAADRKGDVLALQGDTKGAVAEYQKAFSAMEERSQYRRVIEAKLNALGAQTVASAQTTGAAK